MIAVLYTESALIDLRIHECYSNYSLERGNRFSKKLGETIHLLAVMPLLGRLRHDLLSGVRMFVHERHVIFYMLIEDGILVERVASPYQNYEDFF